MYYKVDHPDHLQANRTHMFDLTFTGLQNHPHKCTQSQTESDRHDLSLPVEIRDMGSTFYQSEVTNIWHKDSSFWAAFMELDGTSDIQDLSRQNVCWDREVNEQLHTQFDKVVEHSLERMKKTFSQQTCYEVELKKYLVGRILTSHRFCQEHL